MLLHIEVLGAMSLLPRMLWTFILVSIGRAGY